MRRSIGLDLNAVRVMWDSITFILDSIWRWPCSITLCGYSEDRTLACVFAQESL
jgi:hypothetical protein